jgi:hypothetical protein
MRVQRTLYTSLIIDGWNVLTNRVMWTLFIKTPAARGYSHANRRHPELSPAELLGRVAVVVGAFVLLASVLVAIFSVRWRYGFSWELFLEQLLIVDSLAKFASNSQAALYGKKAGHECTPLKSFKHGAKSSRGNHPPFP